MNYSFWLFIAVAALAVFLLYWIKEKFSLVVQQWETGALYENGRFKTLCGPGRYFDWTFGGRTLHTHRNYAQAQVFLPVDVISQDKLVYRLGATVLYDIKDTRQFLESEPLVIMRLDVEAALGDFASRHSLETALTERQKLNELLSASFRRSANGYEITEVRAGALILPPEVRRMFSEVERARVEGLTALERARGEQASLRTLANAAQLLKNNPELMNLRTLIAASPIAKGGSTIVLGQGALLPTAAPAVNGKSKSPASN
ncbi:MAG: SPFH domain-containing protein [Beijerinckiaceae bacterium]